MSETMNDLAVKSKNDPEALLLMWQGCSRYACKIAMRYRKAAELNGAVDVDDLEQCAFLGFYEAVQGFDPLQGEFTTMLSYGVRHACRRALGLVGRERKEHYVTTSLDAPVPSTEDITLADTIPDETAALPFEQAELRADIKKALHRLPDNMENIIRLHDLQGKSLEQTAAECGLNRQDVCRLRRLGFARIRAHRNLRDYVDFRHKTLAAFKVDHTSIVEEIVIRRLDG